ncbi:MAG: hypothetical protein ACR2PR_02430 [Pseudohongiellaceae bacterium]
MHEVFEDFLEPLMLSGGTAPISEAYRIDGSKPKKPSMRARAKFGTLMCCDYLLTDCKTIIEDTCIEGTIKSIEEEYYAINDNKKRAAFVRKRIRYENCLKVYGTMLVLCQLKEWPAQYEFWLVFPGSPDLTKVVDRFGGYSQLAKEIYEELGYESKNQSTTEGALRSAKLVSKVRVMPEAEFRKRLDEANNN